MARALEDVQTAPPCLPTNALSAAVEFMYVTGTVDPAGDTRAAGGSRG